MLCDGLWRAWVLGVYPREPADLLGASGDCGREFLGDRGERRCLLAVEHQSCGDVVAAQVGEVMFGELRGRVPREITRVFGRGGENDL